MLIQIKQNLFLFNDIIWCILNIKYSIVSIPIFKKYNKY